MWRPGTGGALPHESALGGVHSLVGEHVERLDALASGSCLGEPGGRPFNQRRERCFVLLWVAIALLAAAILGWLLAAAALEVAALRL